MSEAAKPDLVDSFTFCEIAKLQRNVRNKCVLVFPIEQIYYMLIVFATDYQGMASAAFVIKESEHIDVQLELVFIQIDIFN